MKTIALVAHDHCKSELVEWVEYNYQKLIGQKLVCTGTTGVLIESSLQQISNQGYSPENMIKLKSGPLGGDQQLGALIAEEKVDMVIFFWDPMEPHPHDVDVKALLRIAILYNVPIACNRSTADFMISSNLFEHAYQKKSNDFSNYLNRKI